MKVGCAAKVSPQLLERYAMCSARLIQCEEMTNRMGFLSKHADYPEADSVPVHQHWHQLHEPGGAGFPERDLFQIVKENCSTVRGGLPRMI